MQAINQTQVKGIEDVLTRAMSNAEFAEALFADAEAALAGFDLTAEEVASFKGVSREDLVNLGSLSPEDRKSFGWGNHNEAALSIHN